MFNTMAYSKSKAYSDIYDVKHLRWSVLWKQLKIVLQYKLVASSTSWNKYHEVVTPEVAILCKKNYGARGCQGLWIFDIPIFKLISLFVANNSFGLRKRFSQKSWMRLLKLLAKTLRNTCEWVHFLNLFLYWKWTAS